MFQVGQKVVTVVDWQALLNSAGRVRGRGDEIYPQLKVIYTVREIGFLCPHHPKALSVRLNEICNPELNYEGFVYEICWSAKCFRPVIDRGLSTETGMAILRKVADSVSQPVDV